MAVLGIDEIEELLDEIRVRVLRANIQIQSRYLNSDKKAEN